MRDERLKWTWKWSRRKEDTKGRIGRAIQWNWRRDARDRRRNQSKSQAEGKAKENTAGGRKEGPLKGKKEAVKAANAALIGSRITWVLVLWPRSPFVDLTWLRVLWWCSSFRSPIPQAVRSAERKRQKEKLQPALQSVYHSWMALLITLIL